MGSGKRNSLLAVLLVGAALLATWPGQLLAQEARGTIIGQVMDPSGAVIPGASVQITNKAMGTEVSLTTNAAGSYLAPLLIPGLYKMVVTVPGFKKHVRDDLEVRVNERIEVNITLDVGAPDQSVTVTGEVPLLSTASSSQGEIIDPRRVNELPIAHGQPFALAGLAAGVTFNAGAATLNRPFEPTHIAGFAMDGVALNRSDIMIDGVPSTATANAYQVISTYVPPADIVQEFRVQTATFDAQFGNTEGGVINIAIKPGTNDFHGAGYFVKWTPSLTANDWFNNKAGKPKPDYTYNRWGGNIGGPVWIPKIYNGRRKTFFMWGYEGIHEARPRNNCGSTCAVPTDAMWNGDFSSLLPLGANYQIYDPMAGTVSGTKITRTAFAGNIVPSDRISNFAKQVRKYYPGGSASSYAGPATPDLAKTDGQNNHNDATLLEPVTYYTHTFRVDQNIGDRQRLFVRYSFYNRTSNYNNYLGSIATGEWFKFLSQQATIDDVFTLTPTMVLNIRYGYNRFVRTSNSNPGNYGFDLTSLGFSSEFQSQVAALQQTRFPGINMNGYFSTAHSDFWRPCDTHSPAVTLTKQWGSHSLKTGLEMRAYRENQTLFGNDGVLRLTYDGTFTKKDNGSSAAPNPAMGLSLAAMLLDLPTSGTVTNQASYAEQSPTWGIFLQDDWKVTSRLTLNLGVRWEYEGPLTERYNRSVTGFDPTYVQASQAAVQAAYAAHPIPELSTIPVTGGYQFASADHRGLYSTSKRHFMPRLGFAYQVDDKTVIRGGYGVFYGFLGQRRGDVVQSGFAQNTDYTPTNDAGITFPNSMLNPFPTGILAPTGSTLGGATFLNQNLIPFNQDPLTPYEQRFQISFQRELKGGFVADIAYVGNRGTHIEILRDLNATPRQYISSYPFRASDSVDNTIGRLTTNVTSPYKGNIPGGGTLNTGSNIQVGRLVRPYSEFGTITTTSNQGYTWYHSLQATFQKRFSKGFTLHGAYTYSKFMQAVEYLNATDPVPLETISDVDVPHHIAISGIWEFPFGKGKAFGANATPFVSKLISGWQIEGMYVYQSGFPVTFDRTVDPTTQVGSQRGVMFYGDVSTLRRPRDQQKVEQWFNATKCSASVTTNCFEGSSSKLIDTAWQLRTFPLRFGFLRQDPLNNFDLSVMKNTAIAEGKNLQIRFEFLNAMNHPNFAGPNTQPTSSTFGTVTAVQNYSRRIQLTGKFVF